jgi:hypothetical protein
MFPLLVVIKRCAVHFSFHTFQVLEKVQQEAEDLRAHMVQQGTTLLSRNKQSLAAELESASTDEVMGMEGSWWFF